MRVGRLGDGITMRDRVYMWVCMCCVLRWEGGKSDRVRMYDYACRHDASLC